MAKAIRGVLQVHKDVEEEVERFVEQWKSMQGKEPDTVTQLGDVARDQNSVGDVSEEHTNGESMEVTSDHSDDNDESIEDSSEEHNTDESMGDTSAVVMTDMQADSDGEDNAAGSDGEDNADSTSLEELAFSHPNLVWNHDITTASNCDPPETKMPTVFLRNMDLRQVTDDLTLIRTCCLLQMARANNSQIQDNNVPEELFKFLQCWSKQQGRLFNKKAQMRVKAAWECAWVDIEKGADWQLFADYLWLKKITDRIVNTSLPFRSIERRPKQPAFRHTSVEPAVHKKKKKGPVPCI